MLAPDAVRDIVAAARDFQKRRAAAVLQACKESASRGSFDGHYEDKLRIKLGLWDLDKLQITIDGLLLRELNAMDGVTAEVCHEDTMLGSGKVLWLELDVERLGKERDP
jgi:hypothetical protein